MRTFKLTRDHLKLLRRGNVSWNVGFWSTSGAAGLDPRKPYGNSDVLADVARILGLPGPDEDGQLAPDVLDRVTRLHRETETALAVVLATGGFIAGEYRAGDYTDDWVLVMPEMRGRR